MRAAALPSRRFTAHWLPFLHAPSRHRLPDRDRYYSTVKRCRGCGQKPQCTRGKFHTIAIHICEVARQKTDELAKTPEFAVALRKRRKVEALFSELVNSRLGSTLTASSLRTLWCEPYALTEAVLSVD